MRKSSKELTSNVQNKTVIFIPIQRPSTRHSAETSGAECDNEHHYSFLYVNNKQTMPRLWTLRHRVAIVVCLFSSLLAEYTFETFGGAFSPCDGINERWSRIKNGFKFRLSSNEGRSDSSLGKAVSQCINGLDSNLAWLSGCFFAARQFHVSQGTAFLHP